MHKQQVRLNCWDVQTEWKNEVAHKEYFLLSQEGNNPKSGSKSRGNQPRHIYTSGCRYGRKIWTWKSWLNSWVSFFPVCLNKRVSRLECLCTLIREQSTNGSGRWAQQSRRLGHEEGRPQHSCVCLDWNNLTTVGIIMPCLNSFLIFLKSQDIAHVRQSCSFESFLINISEKQMQKHTSRIPNSNST